MEHNKCFWYSAFQISNGDNKVEMDVKLNFTFFFF